MYLAKPLTKSDVPSPIHINHGKANGKDKNFGMDNNIFHIFKKDFEYLQSKGKLIPDNVKSAPIHVNNVAFKYRDGPGRGDISAQKDDGGSNHYYCKLCDLLKQPRKIFTSHQTCHPNCPSMTPEERKAIRILWQGSHYMTME